MSRRSEVEIYDLSEAYEKVNLEALRPTNYFFSGSPTSRTVLTSTCSHLPDLPANV